MQKGGGGGGGGPMELDPLQRIGLRIPPPNPGIKKRWIAHFIYGSGPIINLDLWRNSNLGNSCKTFKLCYYKVREKKMIFFCI